MNGSQTSFLTRAHLFATAFFIILLFLLYEMGRILAPFSAALLWGAVLALALQPVYRWMLQLFRGRSGLAATTLTIATVLLIIGPAVSLLAVLASQAVGLYHTTAEDIQSGAVIDGWSRLESVFSRYLLAVPFVADLDMKALLLNGFGRISAVLAAQAGIILKDLVLLILNLIIMVIALFFFFQNGEAYYRSTIDLLPFTDKQKEFIAQKFYATFAAVLKGVFLIALGQGVITGVGFALFRVPFPVFWGFLAAILALLPIGGAALVWIPGALFLWLKGAAIQGALLGLWGLVFVSLPDNFLKPLLIGRGARLPMFFLFLGILGGLKVYGLLGILFGPLIVTLLTAFIQIYREEFADK